MDKEVMVEKMNVENGVIDMTLSGEPAKNFMTALVQFFLQSGAENFITIEMQDQEGHKYSITVQDCNKEETPTAKMNRQEGQIQAQQQEIDQLKEQLNKNYEDTFSVELIDSLVADKDQQAGRIMALESERNTLLEELDNAQPCFACAGFERNGGKCFGAGTCRIRDLAKLEGLEYTDHAHGESWRWRGLKEVSAIDALLGGAEDANAD